MINTLWLMRNSPQSIDYLAVNSYLDPKEATPKAEAAVRKALELDEGLAEAHLCPG